MEIQSVNPGRKCSCQIWFMSPNRLTQTKGKIKYQLNVQMNWIFKKNIQISFQKIPDIFIFIEDKLLSQIEKYFTSSSIDKNNKKCFL